MITNLEPIRGRRQALWSGPACGFVFRLACALCVGNFCAAGPRAAAEEKDAPAAPNPVPPALPALTDPCLRDVTCQGAYPTTPEPPPAPLADSAGKPVYKKWWFWTIVVGSAAVVAGGIAGGVVASQKMATVPVVPTGADAYRPMF